MFDPAPTSAVAEIGQVIGLRALPELRLFGLDEVADVRVLSDFATRAAGARRDRSRRRRRPCFRRARSSAGSATSFAERAILDHGVGADAAFGADPGLAQQLDEWLDDRVRLRSSTSASITQVSGRKMVTPAAISRWAVAMRIVASSATSSAMVFAPSTSAALCGLARRRPSRRRVAGCAAMSVR